MGFSLNFGIVALVVALSGNPVFAAHAANMSISRHAAPETGICQQDDAWFKGVAWERRDPYYTLDKQMRGLFLPGLEKLVRLADLSAHDRQSALEALHEKATDIIYHTGALMPRVAGASDLPGLMADIRAGTVMRPDMPESPDLTETVRAATLMLMLEQDGAPDSVLGYLGDLYTLEGMLASMAAGDGDTIPEDAVAVGEVLAESYDTDFEPLVKATVKADDFPARLSALVRARCAGQAQ